MCKEERHSKLLKVKNDRHFKWLIPVFGCTTLAPYWYLMGTGAGARRSTLAPQDGVLSHVTDIPILSIPCPQNTAQSFENNLFCPKGVLTRIHALCGHKSQECFSFLLSCRQSKMDMYPSETGLEILDRKSFCCRLVLHKEDWRFHRVTWCSLHTGNICSSGDAT